MKPQKGQSSGQQLSTVKKGILIALAGVMMCPFNVFSAIALNATDEVVNAADEEEVEQAAGQAAPLPLPSDIEGELLPDSIPLGQVEVPNDDAVVLERFSAAHPGRVKFVPVDTVPIVTAADSAAYAALTDEWVPRTVEFNPNPTKAVWLAALFPGLGQVYNRRYWKLPIIVGGFLGLAYATDWNNTMLSDYTKAYADITDNDPTTKSYMDFFPSTVKEENLDKTWITNLLRSRKNYFRRNRDLCIISMVGVYLLAIVDAYVDASLAHFDISPDISMDVYPTLMNDGTRGLKHPSVGLQWAFNF